MKFSFKVNDETCSVGGDEKNADMSVEEAARQSVKKRRISDEHLFQRNGVTSFAYTKQKGVGDYGECSLAVKDGFCWDDSAKIRVMDTVESEADDICDQLTIVDEVKACYLDLYFFDTFRIAFTFEYIMLSMPKCICVFIKHGL